MSMKNMYTYCLLYNFYFQWVLDKSYESSHRVSDMSFVLFSFLFYFLYYVFVCAPFEWICIALKQVSRFWLWFWFYLRRLSQHIIWRRYSTCLALCLSHISCLFLSLTFVSFTSPTYLPPSPRPLWFYVIFHHFLNDSQIAGGFQNVALLKGSWVLLIIKVDEGEIYIFQTLR